MRRTTRIAIGSLVGLSVAAGPALAGTPAFATSRHHAASPRSSSDAATAGAESAKRPRVDVLLHRRLHDIRLGRDVAMIVIDAATGEVISSREADRPMQAASNMKIITATNTLATVGPDVGFATKVLAGPTPTDLILQGGGDALLTRDDLKALAAATATTLPPGATVVVHVDGTLFPAPSEAQGWVDAYIGSSVGFTQALAIRGDRSRQPSRNAVEVFAAKLRTLGINAQAGDDQDAAPDAPVLAEFPGHSAAEAVAVMLSESESGVAEVLFRQVAIASGLPPTWEGSRQAAMDSLTALGVDPTGQTLIDGSGLSRDDRITPRFLSNVLRMTRVTQPDRFAAMYALEAMPTAGRTGTLTRAYGRYSTRPSRCAAGDVQAKTGTILSTIALSGVAKTVFGGTRIFSIIVNHRPLRFPALSTRQAVDGLAATITGCWR